MYLGMRCRIVGLKSREELNQTFGRAVSLDHKTGRYGVELEQLALKPERLALKPENLLVMDDDDRPAVLPIAAAAGLTLGYHATGDSQWQFSNDSTAPPPPPPSQLSRARVGTVAAATATASLEVRPAGVAGLGVFALRPIVPGERVASEAPLLAWSKERDGDDMSALEAAVGKLSPRNRRAYWSMCQNAEHGARRTVYGTWLSNALPTDDASDTAAVFRLISRLNHSAWRIGC